MLFAHSYSLHTRYDSLLVDKQPFELYLYTVSSSHLQAVHPSTILGGTSPYPTLS